MLVPFSNSMRKIIATFSLLVIAVLCFGRQANDKQVAIERRIKPLEDSVNVLRGQIREIQQIPRTTTTFCFQPPSYDPSDMRRNYHALARKEKHSIFQNRFHESMNYQIRRLILIEATSKYLT